MSGTATSHPREAAGIPIAPHQLEFLVSRHGGSLRADARGAEILNSALIHRIVPIGSAGAGDLAPLLGARHVDDAQRALFRGACLLIDDALALERQDVATMRGWFHPFAAWAMADILELLAQAPPDGPQFGNDCRIAPSAVILPRVQIGARVTIAPGAVIGAPGFGYASGPNGAMREIPQLGGVVIEDDVHIGANCTIASGTLGPTIVRRGVKLDAQVHIAHNCEIGEGTVIAAQTGIAGSVIVGRNVFIGGQVGIADHLTIGSGARIAAKSGVIGDIEPGATVAGYPAVGRHRWLRGLAELYRLASGREASDSARPPTRISGLPSAMPPSIPSPSIGTLAVKPPPLKPEAIIRNVDSEPGIVPRVRPEDKA